MPTNKTTAWVLLRGLAREHGHWGPFVELFKNAFPKDDVLPIDLPGSGEFLSDQSPKKMGEIFTFVRAKAIERARSQSQFKIVAMSLGGMVAMEWMNQRPEDLAGCVLINTSAKPLSPLYYRLRWQVWSKFAKVLATQSAKERERQVLDLIMNNEEARDKALPLWTKLAIERPTSYSNFANQLLAAALFGGLKKAVDLPVLVLNGLGDRLVDPSCSTALHEKWGWPVERHPWAGHDLPWDDAEWTIQKIKNWNKDIDPLSPQPAAV
jgi:pimeloyl-ACP methyl ester carboxylesterase